jgi:ribosomal-protein-alanine N-acetyltransferase
MNAEARPWLQAHEVRFRPMTLTDIDGVVKVERASYTFPWSDGIFRDCVRVGYVCRVLEWQGDVSGYGIMSLGAGEAHILNVCVREDLRNRGIARALMHALLQYADGVEMRNVFLEVRPSNPAAIHLYESMGFILIGRRKGYYQASGGREDALVYSLGLVGEAADC